MRLLWSVERASAATVYVLSDTSLVKNIALFSSSEMCCLLSFSRKYEDLGMV